MVPTENRMKMLIIDDSKAMRAFLAHLATQMSFATTEAEDGRDALDVLLKNDPKDPFTIALVDWDMPRMSGIEFIECVRRNREFDPLKLMMVTTANTADKVGRAISAGANEFLMKPVSRQSLAEKLKILGLLDESNCEAA